MHTSATNRVFAPSKYLATCLWIQGPLGRAPLSTVGGLQERVPHYVVVVATLGLTMIPQPYMKLVLHLLRAPYLYSVGKDYVLDLYHHPGVGTREGDPLFPALFSLLTSMVILPLRALSPKPTIMMYEDDLIIFIEREADSYLLKSIWNVTQHFGHFSDLKMNLKRTSAIVRNLGGHEWAACISQMGVEVPPPPLAQAR